MRWFEAVDSLRPACAQRPPRPSPPLLRGLRRSREYSTTLTKESSCFNARPPAPIGPRRHDRFPLHAGRPTHLREHHRHPRPWLQRLAADDLLPPATVWEIAIKTGFGRMDILGTYCIAVVTYYSIMHTRADKIGEPGERCGQRRRDPFATGIEHVDTIVVDTAERDAGQRITAPVYPAQPSAVPGAGYGRAGCTYSS